MLGTHALAELGQVAGRPISGQPVRPLGFPRATEHGLREELW